MANWDNALSQDFHNFAEILRYFNIYNDDLLDNFQNLLLNEGSPDNYYSYIGNGAFKECYELTDDYVIKFCACDNPNQDELDILDAANEAGLSMLFLPTRFMYLSSCTLSPYYVDSDDAGTYRYNSKYHTYEWLERDDGYCLNALFIQPRITKTSREQGYRHIPYLEEEYNKDPVINSKGEAIPFDIIHGTYIDDRDWLEAVIKLYGDETLLKFSAFSRDNSLSDLRDTNIGWIADDEVMRPVILDWMSN